MQLTINKSHSNMEIYKKTCAMTYDILLKLKVHCYGDAFTLIRWCSQLNHIESLISPSFDFVLLISSHLHLFISITSLRTYVCHIEGTRRQLIGNYPFDLLMGGSIPSGCELWPTSTCHGTSTIHSLGPVIGLDGLPSFEKKILLKCIIPGFQKA